MERQATLFRWASLSVGFMAADVGASLREVRIEQGHDLSDAARALRINPDYLRAIEDGRLEALPGVAQRAGFLRAYADWLGCDGTGLAARFRAAEEGMGEALPPHPLAAADKEPPSVLSVVLLAALLAVAVYGVWYFLAGPGAENRATAEPERRVEELREGPDAGRADGSVAPRRPGSSRKESRAGSDPGDGRRKLGWRGGLRTYG